MRNIHLPSRTQFTQAQPQLSRRKLYAAMLIASQGLVAGQVWAAPEGGVVVGGEGIIQQAGVETIINQATERMAIDWRSFDVAANERVEFIQPSSSSIALNRVLGNRGSEILGRIDANGQVMLVNPNGVVFGKNSIVNVGGMIASGLSIDPTSFINGDFALNSIEGADGKVINYGIINAATGGSVTLVGEQVQNDGLISAKLGAVNLVAGNAAVLTFDSGGMLGVRVTEAVVQDELGVDAAVINNGSINAEGGRVLLSASVSEDVFSNAVNNAGMNKESSVVVHDDGSFTLGAGADVVNTGNISVSTTNGNAGQVVALGDNITHSGSISANTSTGAGGSIELHSTDTTLLTENSIVSAQASEKGKGGDVKVLGNKVGLFDQAEVNASGANGGGQALIGGDKTGDNKKIRNADFIYLGENTNVKTDALVDGDGGKLITFASDTARIYGSLYSRGGSIGGDGGFIETSGLNGFEILNSPDVGAVKGKGGLWLIDPFNISITTSGQNELNLKVEDSIRSFTAVDDNNVNTLWVSTLLDALNNGHVTVQTGADGNESGKITVASSINYQGQSNKTLTFLAGNGIDINSNITSSSAQLNLVLNANSDDTGGGDFKIANGVTLSTNGGEVTITGVNFDSSTNGIGTINTSSRVGGGDITINVSGYANVGELVFKDDVSTGGQTQVGNILITAGGDVSLNHVIEFDDTGFINVNNADFTSSLTIESNRNININALIHDNDDGNIDALNIKFIADKNGVGNNGGKVNFNQDIYTAGGNFEASGFDLVFNGKKIDTENANGTSSPTSDRSNGGNVTLISSSNLELGSIVTDAACTTTNNCTGNLVIQKRNPIDVVSISQATGKTLTIAGNSTFDVGSGGDIDLKEANGFTKNVFIASAADVTFNNTKATVLGNSTISGDFTLTSKAITQIAESVIAVTGDSSLQASNENITLANENNNFDGIVTFNNAANVSLRDVDNLIVGESLVAGDVNLTSNSIVLNGNINTTAGTTDDKDITFNGNVILANAVTLTAAGGDITFESAVNSADATARDLTLVSNNLFVKGAVGVNQTLGAIGVTADGKVELKNSSNFAQDIVANSLQVTKASSFLAGNITTMTGNVKITAANLIDVDSIDVSAVTEGTIDLTVNGTGATKTINIDGDLKANDKASGEAAINLTLANTSAPGAINLNRNSFLTSNVTATGSGSADTIKLTNSSNTWSTSGANAGAVVESGSLPGSPQIKFTGFETLTGGTQADDFTITHNVSTAINGGNGNDTFAINVVSLDGTVSGGAGADEFNIDTATTKLALNGGAGADIFIVNNIGSITATLDGGGDSDVINAANRNNSWLLGSTEKLNESLTFSGIENVNGNSGKDSFSIVGDRAVTTGTVNAAGGLDDEVLVENDATINLSSGNFSFFNVLNAEVLASQNGGKLTVLSGAGDAIGWSLDNKTVTKSESSIKFSNFNSYVGGDGNDTFSTTSATSLTGLIDGAGGTNIFDVSLLPALTGNSIVVANIYQTGSFATLANIKTIKGNNLTSLQLTSGTNTWSITGLHAGSANTIDFTGVSSIIGASSNDNIRTSINDGADWGVTGINTGTLAAHTSQEELIAFSNIGRLVGSNFDDKFSFSTGSSVVSAQGNGGTDTADLSNLAPQTITVGGSTGFAFSGVEVLQADITKDFVLTTSNGATWNINGGSGENSGEVLGTKFVGFKTLQGSGGADTFNLTANFEGEINAGGGDDTFNIRTDYSGELQGENGADHFIFFDGGKTAVDADGKSKAIGGDGIDTVNLSNIDDDITVYFIGAKIHGVDEAERVVGNSGRSFTLDSNAATNQWTISSSTGGSVGSIEFSNFKVLLGGSGVDIFNVNSNFTGTLNGLGGADEFTITTAFSGSLDGGDGDDIFRINAAVTGNISGGLGSDRFIFNNNGSVNPAQGNTADAGVGNDEVDLSGVSADRVIALNGSAIYGLNGIERVIGNSNWNFTLDASETTTALSWLIDDIDGVGLEDGVNDGRVQDIEFINFRTLRGSKGSDSFTFKKDFTGTVEGLNGDDVFNITTFITGDLLGGDGADRFVFSAAGSIANNGSASAGDGADIVDLSTIATVTPVVLTGGNTLYGVSDVERIIGNNLSTLSTNQSGITWEIYDFDGDGGALSDGVNDGKVAGIEFVNFKNLQGSAGADTFNLRADFAGIISGGDGEDAFNIYTAVTGTLLGEGGRDTYFFHNGGSVASTGNSDAGDGSDKDRADFSNLDDGIKINVAGSLIGNIAGIEQIVGSATKQFTLAATSESNTWKITGTDGGNTFGDGQNDGIVNGIQFINFKKLEGGSGSDEFIFEGTASTVESIDGGLGVNTLQGRNAINTWQITTANAGTVSANGNVYTTFSRIQNLIGGTLADLFNINAAITDIAGGNGDDRFVFDSLNNAGTVTSISGGDGENELVGRDTDNIWTTSGNNSGSIAGYVTAFSGIQRLVGGDGADVFNLNHAITNGVQAGDGSNIFNVNTTVGHLIGGAGNDQFIFGDQGDAQSVNGGGGNANSLTGRNGVNIWTIESSDNSKIAIGANTYLDSFSNIQILNGGTGNDTFNINAAAGSIYGGAGNDTFSFAGSNNGTANLIDGGMGTGTTDVVRGRTQDSMWTMTGTNTGHVATGGTTYIVAFTGIESLDGEASSDTLAAVNQANTWTVSGVNSGSLRAAVAGSTSIAFEGMENLLGNEGIDAFVFSATGANITGIIDGGSSVTKNVVQDSLDLRLAGNRTVNLGAHLNNVLNVANIETITASTANVENNVIRGASDTAYRWNIDGADTGVIEKVDNPLLENSVRFVNFGDLRGGANSDRFNVQSTVSRNIDGGDGDDLVDYSKRQETFTITLGGSGELGITGITGIEGVVGNSAAGNGFTSTIKVNSGYNTWEIDGENDGSISIGGNKISFENFTNLIGGSGTDIFNFLVQGQWIGTIDGGDGDNTIDSTLSLIDQKFVVDGTGSTSETFLKNIDEIKANSNTNSTLASRSRANTWQVNNNEGFLNSGMEFANIANLEGGDFVDNFIIANLSSLTGVINGGGGEDIVNLGSINKSIQVAIDDQTPADANLINVETINANNNFSNTLLGKATGNEWAINALNAGVLNKNINFAGFANVKGSAGIDKVAFVNNAANLTGHIDLAGGNDSLDLTASGRGITVQLNSVKDTLAAGVLSVDNVESISGAVGQQNRLIADNFANTWTISNINDGQISSTEKSPVLFSEFASLTGGNKDDIFNFEASGNVTGLLSGGENITRDVVDLSKSNVADVVIATMNDVAGFANIEKYIGNNIDSSLTAANVANTWSLNGANRGTLNGTIEFENFGILKGGNQQDKFTLNQANISGSIDSGDGDDSFKVQESVIAGKIQAGKGNDEFEFFITPGFSGMANIDGGEGINRLAIIGGDASYKASHQFGSTEYIDGNNNTYSILYSDINNIFDDVVANSLSIYGTSALNTFRLQTGRYSIDNNNLVNFTNKANLVVNGLAGDKAVIDGVVNVAGGITFSNLNVLAENSGVLQAQSLDLVSTGDVGSSTNRLKTVVSDLSLNATNGDIYLEELDALNLKSFNVSTTDLVDLNVGGNLSTTNPLVYAGTLNIESLRGNINLGNNNLLSGILNLRSTQDISLGNTQALLIGNLSSQNANLSSGTSIASAGIFSVSGLTTLNAITDITLANSSNDFNQLAILNAGAASIYDKNGLTTVGISTASNAELRSAGNIIIAAACSADCANNYGIKTGSLKIQSDASVSVTKNIIVAENTDIQAQGITVGDALTSKKITLNAGNGKLLLNEAGSLSAKSNGSIELAAGSIEQHSAIVSDGNIKAAAAGDIVMMSRATTESQNGDVDLSSNSMQLALLKAVEGSVILNAKGAITDGNLGETNIVANTWRADAVSGIGAEGIDAIETDVERLSVRNFGSVSGTRSSINIANTNSVVIEQLINNGNILFSNANGDVVLDNTNNLEFDITKTNAIDQGGVINANTGVNGGVLTLSINGGSVRALNKANKANPDVIAESAAFVYPVPNAYTFGERNRKIVMHIPDYYYQSARTSSVLWHIKKPATIVDSSVPLKNLLTNDQLIQLEALNEIDPAIFTNVRNYVHDEVAILMPVDQRFDEDEYAE